MKNWLFILILALLWHPHLSLADTSTQATPRITIPDPSYQFDPAIEGDMVTHEFTLINSGNALLEILKIQTG